MNAEMDLAIIVPLVKINGAHTESVSIGPGLINIYLISSAVMCCSVQFVWKSPQQADVVEVHRA